MLLLLVACLVLMDLILLITWLSVDPMRVKDIHLPDQVNNFHLLYIQANGILVL